MNFSKTNKETHVINIIIRYITLISALFLATQFINAQASQSHFINYQGVARDAEGDILADQDIALEIELRFGAPNISSLYTETHNVTTDAGGVFNLRIGDGTTTFGDYDTLEWGNLAPYINVSLNGTEIGTTEMHAVPYALSSGNQYWFPAEGVDDIAYEYGNVGIGTDEPEADLHVDGDLLVQSNSGKFKIGYPGDGNQWHFSTLNGGEDLLFQSRASGSATVGNRFTLKQNGHVGIGNTNPDEELVIGDNLGAGWAIPAATIGNATGGGLQVGNPTTNLKLSSSSTFGYSRIRASDATGVGEGIIEMRTRQLNIGTAPGVGDNAYAVRIVQPSIFGLQLVNGTDATKNWELFGSNSGNLNLYSGAGLVGNFNENSGNYSATSDRRLKTNINPAQNVLNKVTQLDAKSYNYKTNLKKQFIGFIAQDIQEQFPEVVSEIADREGKNESTLMVDYNQLTVIALKAIKEQQQTIETLKARIKILENN
ncbi:tail fiber domain-containing protein [Winogradskyella sp.]|uniref:tail fiber domain-containing protein n=1 Tax=Winogradskyella sp. TaxID=1883156 RepID=UPI003AB40460